jgi:hypothetical protein
MFKDKTIFSREDVAKITSRYEDSIKQHILFNLGQLFLKGDAYREFLHETATVGNDPMTKLELLLKSDNLDTRLAPTYDAAGAILGAVLAGVRGATEALQESTGLERISRKEVSTFIADPKDTISSSSENNSVLRKIIDNHVDFENRDTSKSGEYEGWQWIYHWDGVLCMLNVTLPSGETVKCLLVEDDEVKLDSTIMDKIKAWMARETEKYSTTTFQC